LGAAVVTVALLVLGGLLLRPGEPVAGHTPAPADDSVEAGFARDMAVHHQQAVELALLVRDRGAAPAVARLAYDTITTQGAQRGMLLGWLQAWGLSATSARPPMGWMGMSPPSGRDLRAGVLMPGMASRADRTALAAASGRQADARYLRLMIRHHAGGIHMAVAAADAATTPYVAHLAEGMVAAQRAETELMNRLLADL
jgi:uncharacterized protein (DUF305 family)